MPDIPAKVDVVVVGGGQAGIAASEHLQKQGLSHVVFEKDRLAESWRTRRWDSLVANGPAWHDRFPNLLFKGDQDGFAPKDSVVNYLEEYAQRINMPTFSGVSVTEVTPLPEQLGFTVRLSSGEALEAKYVIAATGSFQIPVYPNIIPATEHKKIKQMHSLFYKSPEDLPAGNVLVVGAGSSGAQIAEELILAEGNRKVFLSVGEHDRPPRSYRGRDFCWWLGVLNMWDMEATPGVEHTTIAVSGARGGRTMDFRRLALHGAVLLGRTNAFKDGKLLIGDDLQRNIEVGDKNYISVLDEADAFIEANGLDLPLEPQARELLPDPECLKMPLRELDLRENNITSIVWATGFRNDYKWLSRTKALDSRGSPVHKRGVSDEVGIYFLGLPWQTRRGSSFIWGVWYDAQYIVDHIAKQEGYLKYAPGVTK